MNSDARQDARQDMHVRGIALFFIFALMDEKVALEAAHKTIAQLKATRGNDELGPHELVATLRKGYEHYRKHVPRQRGSSVAAPSPARATAQAAAPPAVFALPELTDLAPWQKFQREATEAEMIAVIFSKILRLPDEAIAQGLNISVGTARYRIGKGIRHLGVLARQPANSKRA